MMASPDSLAMSSQAHCPAAILITLLQLLSLCCFLGAEGHCQTLAVFSQAELLDLGYTMEAFFKPLPSQLLGERRRAQRIIPKPPPVPRFDKVPPPSPAPPLPRFHRVPRPAPAPPPETWNQLHGC